MCTKNEFNEWVGGKIYRNDGCWYGPTSVLKDKDFLTYDEAIELIKSSEHYEEDKDIDFREYGIYSYEDWGEYYETDITNYTTPNGEEIVAVCYYGYDG